MTVAETVDIVAKLEFIAIQHMVLTMECKQPHYFFIILSEDSWGILTVIPCERMIIGNCITAKVNSPAAKVYKYTLKQPLLVLQIQKT